MCVILRFLFAYVQVLLILTGNKIAVLIALVNRG